MKDAKIIDANWIKSKDDPSDMFTKARYLIRIGYVFLGRLRFGIKLTRRGCHGFGRGSSWYMIGEVLDS
jgi:hypothetical protein